MFFSKNPVPMQPRISDVLLGTEKHPGLIRRLLALMRQPGKVFAEISQPLEISTFLGEADIMSISPEYQALRLRRRLLLQHNRHRQSITGPVIKSHEELKESILAEDRMRQFIAQYAESRKESLQVVRKKADGYLDEIAARYSHFFIGLVAKPLGWLMRYHVRRHRGG